MPICERLRSKTQGWQGKLISQAGREVLIKAVGQSIPSYCMGVFMLPKTLLEVLRKMLNTLWWGTKSEGRRKRNWVAWEELCLEKDQGGMGFRLLKDFNLAMLAKQGWNILKKPTSLIARLLKYRYYRNGELLKAKLGHNRSFS